jgi:chromosomal replication initiation ATPase DnaA
MNHESIIKAVAEEYGITPDDISSNIRKRPMPEARKMCCYILAKFGEYSYPDVANLLNVDRSNVYLAIANISDWIEIYTEIRNHFNRIMEKLLADEIKTY